MSLDRFDPDIEGGNSLRMEKVVPTLMRDRLGSRQAEGVFGFPREVCARGQDRKVGQMEHSQGLCICIGAVVVETIVAQDTPTLFPHQLERGRALEEPFLEHHALVHNSSQLPLLQEKRLDGRGYLAAGTVVWCFVLLVLFVSMVVILSVAMALTFGSGLFLTEFTAFVWLGHGLKVVLLPVKRAKSMTGMG